MNDDNHELIDLLASGDLDLLDVDSLENSKPITLDMNYGFSAVELQDVMQKSHIQTGQMCSGLSLPNTRWPKIIKVSDDARNMQYELISPEIEMFVRLTNIYPEAAPWSLKSIDDLVDITGWGVKELSLVCAAAETSVHKWLNEAKKSMDSQSAILIDLIYKLISIHKVKPNEVLKIANSMRENRNKHQIQELIEGTWQTNAERAFRRARKLLRETILALKVDESTATTSRLKDKILFDFITNQIDVSDLQKRSELKGKSVEKDDLLNTCQLLGNWFDARNAYHEHYMEQIRETNGRVVPSDSNGIIELRCQFEDAVDALAEKHPDFVLGY